MNMKMIISISEARKKLFQIADEVQKPAIYYTLTKKGRPKVVMMSAEEFESWQETLEVMKDFPDLDKDIKRVDRDVKTDAYKKYPALEEVMAKYGFILADKSKKKYEISSKSRKRSGKKSRKNS